MSARSCLFLLVLVAGGCDPAQRADRPPPPASPPAAVVAREGQFFDEVVLSWQPTCGSCTGFALEASYDAIAYAPVGSLVPPWATAVTLHFAAATPELQPVWFRLQARRGGERSSWSEPISYLRGIRPALLGTAITSDGLVQVTWTNQSQVADALVLERGSATGSNVPSVWTPLQAAFGDTQLLDPDCPELQRCVYRLRYGKGRVWSRDAEGAATPPLRQPADLRAAVTPSGVVLSWTNRSAAATGVAIHCSACAAGAVLPPSATTWVDAWGPPRPSGRYWIEAFDGRPSESRSALPEVGVPAFRIEGALTLDARSDVLMPGTHVVGDPMGVHAYLVWEQGPSVVAVRSDGAAEDRTASLAEHYARPGLLLDGGGNPHLVAVSWSNTTALLTHAWHDGVSWKSEDIGPLAMPWPYDVWFGVDRDGNLQLLYEDGSAAGPVHGVQSSGTWTWGRGIGYRAGPFAVAGDGTAYAVGEASLGVRPPGEGWQEEPFPSGVPGADLLLPLGAPGQVALLGYDSRVGFEINIVYAERSAAGWSAAESVARISNGRGFSAVPAPDGSHIYLSTSVLDDSPRGEQTKLLFRAGGTWSGMTLAPTPSSTPVMLGFSGTGKLWLGTGGDFWMEP